MWTTREPEGLSTPLWCGQAGCPSRGIGAALVSGGVGVWGRGQLCEPSEHHYLRLRVGQNGGYPGPSGGTNGGTKPTFSPVLIGEFNSGKWN